MQELAFFQQMTSAAQDTDAAATIDILCKSLELSKAIRKGLRPEISLEEEATMALALLHFAESIPESWHNRYKQNIFIPLTYSLMTIQNYRHEKPMPTLTQ